MPINPSFHRFPGEATIIGRLLAVFGELEVTICYNASRASNLGNLALAALYRIRTTRTRLEAADALMRSIYSSHNLLEVYSDGFSRVIHCLRIRTQFAHCNWGDNETAGVFFVDLQAASERTDFAFHWKHIDAPLLQSHELYFDGALAALRFADHEIEVKQGKLKSHVWPKPPMSSPPPHYPEALHIPPWISEDDKALHLARTQAGLSGVPTPTQAHQTMEAKRETKRAQRAAHRDRSLNPHSPDKAEILSAIERVFV